MKRFYLFILLIMLITLMLCACIPVQDPAPATVTDTPGGQEQAPAQPSTVRLTMATGGTSGIYYPYGGTLALAIAASSGYIKITVNSTSASGENIQQIGSGLAQLAIVQNDILYYAYNGADAWAFEPVKNVTTLMSLYPEVCQLIVSADSGIESVAGLKDKRISLGDSGSGAETNALQILEAYGLTVDDVKAEYLGFGASAAAMKEKSLDGFFVTSGLPNTAVLELAASHDIRVISLDDNKIGELIAKYPFYAKAQVSGSDYSFLSEPAGTVSVQAALIASPDVDEQVVYDIVKGIIEGKEGIMVANAKGAFIDPTYAVQGISVDLHPGAKRYFQEIGAL